MMRSCNSLFEGLEHNIKQMFKIFLPLRAGELNQVEGGFSNSIAHQV